MREHREDVGATHVGGSAAAASICEKVVHFAGSASSVLAVGASRSGAVGALEAKRFAVTAIEPDSLEKLAGGFACAFVEDAMETVEDLDALLRGIRARLLPHGTLVVAIANAGHAALRLAMLARGPRAMMPAGEAANPRRRFDLALLEEALSRSGLIVESIERTVAPLFVPSSDLPYPDAEIYPEDVVQRLLLDVDSETASFVVLSRAASSPARELLREPIAQSPPARSDSRVETLQRELGEYRLIVRVLSEKLAALEADQEAQVRELLRLREEASRARELASELVRLEKEVVARNDRIASALRDDLERLQLAIDQIYASRFWRIKRVLNGARSLILRRRTP